MNELTIKQKAELYDKAIERGNSLLSCNELGNAWVYKLLPELKESEDEQIRKEDEDVRKWLISQLEIKSDMNNSCELELMILKSIAWLEKQASYTYTFEIKAGHWYKCVCDYMLNDSDLGYKNGNLYYCRRNWRLVTEIKDEQNVKDIGVNGYKSFFRPATNQEIKDWLVKECDQKFSWSKEDEKKRTLLMKILEVNHPHGLFKVNSSETMRTEELISWLESINYKI